MWESTAAVAVGARRMPEPAKLRVFVSSAVDGDVADERAAAKAAIDTRYYSEEFVGVERWSASGDSALKNSLNQLRDCDVFLGIFGRRCGRVTLAEYELAKTLPQMRRLLFFREVAKPPGSVAADPQGEARVETIRKDAESDQGSTWKAFSDPSLLRAYIGEALSEERNRRDRRQPPRSVASPPQPILATLCDREEQRPEMNRMLHAALNQGKQWLLVFGVHGAEEEDHEALVEWYHDLRLHPDYKGDPGAAKTDAKSAKRDIVRLEWNKESRPVADRLESLVEDLASQLVDQDPRPGSQQDLRAAIPQALNGAKQHITLRYHLRTANAGDRDLLRDWLQFLLQMPLVTDRHLISVFFCFRHVSSAWSLFSSSTRNLRSCIEMMGQWPDPAIKVLPELLSPVRDHAVEWADTRCLNYYPKLSRTVLKRDATAPFQSASKIPFETLKGHLENALAAAYRAYQANQEY